MTCSLNWYRRDDTGKRQQIQFHLVREKASWSIHRQRNEPREPYEPDGEDWATLMDNLQRNLQRGKVYPEDVRIVRTLMQRALE